MLYDVYFVIYCVIGVKYVIGSMRMMIGFCCNGEMFLMEFVVGEMISGG